MSTTPHIRRINPSALAAPTGYTHVVEVTSPARMVYLAGQVAFDERRSRRQFEGRLRGPRTWVGGLLGGVHVRTPDAVPAVVG